MGRPAAAGVAQVTGNAAQHTPDRLQTLPQACDRILDWWSCAGAIPGGLSPLPVLASHSSGNKESRSGD